MARWIEHVRTQGLPKLAGVHVMTLQPKADWQILTLTAFFPHYPLDQPSR
jgi:hypothetical protein